MTVLREWNIQSVWQWQHCLLILYNLAYKDWKWICIWHDLWYYSMRLVRVGILCFFASLCFYTEFGEGAALTRLFKDALRNKQSGTATHKHARVHRHSAIQICVLLCQNILPIYFGKRACAFLFSKTMENTIHNNQLIGFDKQNLAIHTQNVPRYEYRNGPHKTATSSDQV